MYSLLANVYTNMKEIENVCDVNYSMQYACVKYMAL